MYSTCSPLAVTCEIICFSASKSSSRQHTRLSSHPQMKLSSVWRLMLVILHRRSKRVGLVLSCVRISSEFRCANAESSSWDLPCFAQQTAVLRGVEWSFILRDHPTPLPTAEATGPATVEYKQHRVYTAHASPDKGCIAVCKEFKPS